MRGDLLGLAQRLHLAREHVDELTVHRALGVDALERLESRQVQRIDLERAVVIAEPLIDFVHLPFEQLAQIGEDLFAIGVGRRDIERAGQRLPQLLPLPVLR